MTIEHIAIWTKDIELMRTFYMTYFEAQSGKKYANTTKSFESYFLTFQNGARIELMNIPGIQETGNQNTGYAHIAFSVGSKERVLALTEQIRKDGYEVSGDPRTTGDGYFESVVLDPEGNRIEITV